MKKLYFIFYLFPFYILPNSIILGTDSYLELIYAIKEGNQKKCKAIIDKEQIPEERFNLINTEDEKGDTPLLIATKKGDKHMVKFLLGYKVNINHQNKTKVAALYVASYKNCKDIVELLLKNKADVNLKNGNGYTSLFIASLFAYKEIVEILLQNKASVNLQDRDGYTSLFIASLFAHREIVEILLKNKASINLQNKYGQTPLLITSFFGHKDIVELLLKNKADVNLEDKYGDTSLLIAIKKFRVAVAMLLLKYGADGAKKNKIGETPIKAFFDQKDIFATEYPESICDDLLMSLLSNSISFKKNKELTIHLKNNFSIYKNNIDKIINEECIDEKMIISISSEKSENNRCSMSKKIGISLLFLMLFLAVKFSLLRIKIS